MAQDADTPPAADYGPQYNWYPWQEQALETAERIRRRNEEGSPSDYIQSNDYGLQQQNHYQWVTTTGSNTGPEGFPGGVQAGPPLTQSPNAHCRKLGHKWRTNGLYENARVEEFVCERCNMTKRTTVSWGVTAAAHSTITPDAARELLTMANLKPFPWVCFYCGATFEDEDVLLDHEDDCAET